MSDERITELEKQDIRTNARIDLIVESLARLKERLDHSSATGHKSWESLQRTEGAVGEIKAIVNEHSKDIKALEGKSDTTRKVADGAHDKYDDMNKGIFRVALAGIVLAILKYLFTGKLFG